MPKVLIPTILPGLAAYEYKGYIICAWARPEFTSGSTSVGIVYTRGELGSIIHLKRIEGKLFGSKEEAEQDGVELCKEWVDKQKVLNFEFACCVG